LDHPGAAVFHVRLTDKGTVVEQAINPHEKSNVCADLGFRASDLLQSNCVVWVEGPSDRIYIREWIRIADESLVEGVHYTVMFYGGKLLSHLTPDDPNEADVGRFISLRKLNRNLVVILDSDRKSDAAKVNATKMRIVEEFKKAAEDGGHGFAWITDGREIENYIAVDAFNDALSAEGVKRTVKTNKFADYPGDDGNKVAIALWLVANNRLSLDGLDLKEKIDDLVRFIRQSNEPTNPFRA
jgi:hypothetical protein